LPAVDGPSPGDGVGVGVVGIEHLHCFELVDGLASAGARTVAHAAEPGPLADAYAAWRTDSRALSLEDLLADPAVGLVVLAGVPSTRAEVAVAALRAGKAVLSDKPGVTTADQLAAVRAAVDDTGGRWWVLFSERFGVPAVMEAVHLARAGAIGDVVHVQGSAPHRGSLDARPDWFFDRTRTGGILVDLGSHQADQFLALTAATDAVVVASAAGNVGAPDHPGLEDVGEMVLAAGGARGHHRVDFLEADGFPAWGDIRLVVTGTTGRLEVRITVTDDGAAGPTELVLTDHLGVHRVDVSAEVDWPRRLLADLADGGERLMDRDHPFRVTALTLEAAALATTWGSA
jgi:predicted dehydrogenase